MDKYEETNSYINIIELSYLNLEELKKLSNLPFSEKDIIKYNKFGKIFAYLDKNGNIVSYIGCINNHKNSEISFEVKNQEKIFYIDKILTMPNFDINEYFESIMYFFIDDYAKDNEIDLIYISSNLLDSTEKKIMKTIGFESLSSYMYLCLTQEIEVIPKCKVKSLKKIM